MSDNNKYSVEDFWPDAEKLLDDHFNRIPFWKRNLKHLLITFTVVAVAISVFLYNYSPLNTSQNTQEINALNADKNTQGINKENKISLSSHAYSNSISGNPAQGSSHANNSLTKNDNNLEIEIAQNSNQTELTKLDNQASDYDSSAGHKVSSAINSDNKTLESINSLSSTSNESSSKAISATQNIKEDNSWIVATESSSIVGNNSYLNLDDSSSETKLNTKETEKSNTNSSININSSEDVVADEANIIQKVKDFSNNSIKDIPSSNSIDDSESNNALLSNNQLKASVFDVNFEKLESHSFNELLGVYGLNSSEFPLKHSELILPKNKRKNISMRYELNASVFYLSKKLTSGSFDEYVDRRNAEEDNLLNMSYGLGAEIQINRFGIFTGVDVMNYGEKITYQNWLYGDVNQVLENEEYISDSALTPYYNYIQGNEYEFFETTYQTDTLITYDTSQVQGQIAGDVTHVNTSTRLSYIEIPLGLSYSLPLNGRLKVGLRAGMSIGFLRELKGYYIDPLLTEFTEIKDLSIVNSTILNSRLAVDLNYYLRPGLSVFARPEWRSNLNSMLSKDFDISQRYNAVGVTFGVSKSF